MRYLKVTVRNLDNQELRCRPYPPRSLRDLLRGEGIQPHAGLFRYLNCGGRGLCGTCTVRVVDNPAGLTDRTPAERARLRTASPQSRLSCQAHVCDDVVIDTRKTDLDDREDMAREAGESRTGSPV